MNAELLQSIVIAILVVTFFQFGMLYKLNANIKELVALNKKWGGPSAAEHDLFMGDIDALIERSLKDISEHPRHPKPRWYLARAYYKKEMWADATQHFDALAMLEPSWRHDSIDPYLLAIDARMGSVSDSSNS